MGEKRTETEAPVIVRNQDIPLLSEILYIMQDIAQLEKRRDWQRDRMVNITQHLSAAPSGGGHKGFDEAFSALSEIDAEHETRCREYARQLKKAQKILNSIESRAMRTFVLMKYVMDVPDIKIRQELNMTWRGFERARKAVESAPCMAAVKWQEKYIVRENNFSQTPQSGLK